MKYADFLDAKAQKNTGNGFDPLDRARAFLAAAHAIREVKEMLP